MPPGRLGRMTGPADAQTSSGSAPRHFTTVDAAAPLLPTTPARDPGPGLCPYLASSGGAWRHSTPSRRHRCVAVAPPAPQPVDKQRRHCLSREHVDCSTFRAARGARTTTLAAGADPALVETADRRRRPIARTAPVLLEPSRLVDQAVRLRLDRAPGQVVLVALMIVAFAIVALARLSAAGDSKPSPASIASSPPPASLSPSPGASLQPTASASLAAPSSPPASPSVVPAASSAPSFRASYTVKPGDTLIGIAGRFNTTTARIRSANNLSSSALRVGQVLKIP